MFSIGEFARLGTVSIRALRHYDEIGLLRPAKVDPEGAMPADDIVVKKLPAMGVVVIAEPASAFGTQDIIPAVNRAEEQFRQLGIRELVKEAGPYFLYYEGEPGTDLMVHLALPVAEPPAELPPPARYIVLPEIKEAAVAVRSGPAANIFPFVYHDLARWADERGYQTLGLGRQVWAHMVDDVSEVSQQVFEIQLPFTRPESTPS